MKCSGTMSINSAFQHILIYTHLDKTTVSFGSQTKRILTFEQELNFRNLAENLQEELEANGEEKLFVALRWYDFSAIQNTPNSAILKILLGIEKMVRSFAKVCAAQLNEANEDLFLEQYHKSWQTFSYLIGSLYDNVQFLEDTINEIDKHIQDNFDIDSMLHFSFMRFLVKIWD